MSADAPTRVAVLGGGLGSMAAALELTSTPELRARYDVTVYQMGWRLGGKGASGRNAECANRIEEHGLHIWLGFYENAFRMIRQVYDEWTPSPGCPFAYWTDAFQPHTTVTFMERVGGAWKPWTIETPLSPQLPGDASEVDSVWSHLIVLMEGLRTAIGTSNFREALAAPHESPLHRVFSAIRALLVDARVVAAEASEDALDLAIAAARHLPVPDEHVTTLLESFRTHVHDALRPTLDGSDEARHLFVQLDLASAVIRGLIAERVLTLADFNRLDAVDLRDWLARHHAAPESIDAGPIRAWYDLGFSYAGGDPSRPSAAAGTALRALLRMAAGYKGAIMWKMQAGMGDTVFTPSYEVLKARGVRFRFFHRVDRLRVDAASGSIATIDIAEQAKVRGDAYDPLVDVEGLRCWPSAPDYAQLADGDALRRSGADLESHWTSWPDAARSTLTRGKDFDLVVLGISLGALRGICEELVTANAGWRAMIDNIPTVRTQAFQTWLRPNARGLGWPDAHTVLAGYVEPLATWGDMSHLVPRETWPAGHTPGSIAYVCGPLPGPDADPPRTDAAYPTRAHEEVRAAAVTWLANDARGLWPRATSGDAFAWDALVDVSNQDGEARFASQYWRANIDPSARYVQTPPLSIRYRLEPGESGFANLFLAGDWVFTGINGGCVEAAVMGGMKAAQAICGTPAVIVGDVRKSNSPLPQE